MKGGVEKEGERERLTERERGTLVETDGERGEEGGCRERQREERERENEREEEREREREREKDKSVLQKAGGSERSANFLP